MADCFICHERLRNSESIDLLDQDFDILCSFCTLFLKENDIDEGVTLGRKLRSLLEYQGYIEHGRDEEPNVFVDGNVIDASKLFEEKSK
jgi:hypothetical protein